MAKNTIKLRNYLNIEIEKVANAAITPGHLIEEMSTGKVRVHATAGGTQYPMIAVEDELQGKGVDDAYAAGDQVKVWIPTRGDVASMILKNGENVAIGDFLESAGDGTVQKYVVDTDSSKNTTAEILNIIIGQAITALDLSGSSALDAIAGNKVQVRIY
jgi:hypothetical protein